MRASHSNLARLRFLLPALALVALAAFVFSGCGWTGKGKDVAQAMEKTATFDSRAFTGAMNFKMSGSDAAKSMSMTFTGASDNSDKANPKMTMSLTMTADSQSSQTTIAMPGDGNMYMVTPTGTFGAPVPAADRSKTAIDSAAIYAALGKAIGHFQDSQPMQNAAGKPVKTIAAKVDREKICNEVLPAFGDLMSKASAGSGAGAMPGFSGGAGGLGGFCKIMLVGDPQIWFGIDNGALTDAALKANLAFPGAGAMQFDLDYHEYNQGQPQPSIKKPAGAKLYPSVQAFADSVVRPTSQSTAPSSSPSPYAASQ